MKLDFTDYKQDYTDNFLLTIIGVIVFPDRSWSTEKIYVIKVMVRFIHHSELAEELNLSEVT